MSNVDIAECIIGGAILAVMVVGALCWTYYRAYRCGYRDGLDRATQINRETFGSGVGNVDF